MKLTEKQELLIQDYLSDSLTAEHQLEFDEQIKDSNFRKSLWLQANVLKGLADHQNDKLRQKIEGFGESDSKTIHIRTNNWMKYAAILALLLGAIFIMKSVLPNGDTQSNALFAKYYRPVPSEDISRGGQVSEASMQALMNAYNAKDYELALSTFDKFDFNKETQIYKLISLIEVNRLSDAAFLSEKLKTSPDKQTQDMAQWYEVLILLKQNRKVQAKQLASRYSGEINHTFQRELTALLSDLK